MLQSEMSQDVVLPFAQPVHAAVEGALGRALRAEARARHWRPCPGRCLACQASRSVGAQVVGHRLRQPQIGHADPATTLNHYAHAMKEDDEDLSFA